ncbi:MAG: iron-containing alcohol dehydrogenase [Muribaculaceae bacterium]|nr:iron-containing alcohol dehydrogenase [Muribaculaceae bacterium]
MKSHGYLDVLLAGLKRAGVAATIFDKAMPNPINEHVMEGTQVCVSQGCDFVIGMGGGSSIDTAKAIAITAAMGGNFWDYVQGGTGGGKPITHALPIVAIPSTAGTGTEIDLWGVITNEKTQEKMGFGSPHIYPQLAIVDPELMLTVPPMLTAYQGFDAFFHAAEGYISQAHSPISDLYALEAIRLLYKYLPVAVADGNNMWARIKVAWASTLAGMVESTSCCTGEHALEHAMSAFYPKLPHGAGLIAISGAYFKTFKNDVMKRYMKMAEKMRQVKSARPSDFLDALEVMKRSCGVDNIRLSDWGITMADFERFADNAIATGSAMLDLDPRFLNREELIGIYMDSYK